MTVTEKRLAANRRNAERSRGPRTARGKSQSSRNRTSHGLSAREITLTRAEKAAERKHLAQWLAYFQPVTDAELGAITQAVRAVVILDRIDQVERELIAESDDEYGLPVSLINFTLRYERPWNLKLHRAIDELHRLRAERPETASEAQFEPTELSPQVLETIAFEPRISAQRSGENEAISAAEDGTSITDPAQVPSTTRPQPLDRFSSTPEGARQLQIEPTTTSNSNPVKAGGCGSKSATAKSLWLTIAAAVAACLGCAILSGQVRSHFSGGCGLVRETTIVGRWGLADEFPAIRKSSPHNTSMGPSVMQCMRNSASTQKPTRSFVTPKGCLPLIAGRVTFIRRVSVAGTVTALSQAFRVGKKHRGLYVRLL